MAEVIVRDDRVIIKTDGEDDAYDLSRALDQLSISHQIICFDGFYNAVQFDGTEYLALADDIIRSDRVIIHTDDEDAADALSSALDQLGISHQHICFDGSHNMVRFWVTEPLALADDHD